MQGGVGPAAAGYADEVVSDGYPGVGDMIGPYSVGRRLGAGGMGVVFEALDTKLQRAVALKVIAPHLAGDPEFRERFTREARAQASLDSAHVVHVYDHGEDPEAGRLYIATQLVPDGDLGAMIHAHGAPPRLTAVDLMAQVASGLADAHDAGLVHRDLKPSNVLLRRRQDGLTAYLADFGIARRADADHTLTAAGTAGTPRYMAPELHTGTKAGPRTDVYSLGCLLWATLTGSAPYAGESEWEVVSAHRDQPVRQLPGSGALVDGINRVLARSMAKDPAERYPHAGEVRDDLRALLSLPPEGEVVPVAAVDPPARDPLPPPRHARRRVVALTALLVVLAVVAVAVWALTWGAEDEQAQGRAAEPTGAVTTYDEEVAVASLADALAAEGLVSGSLARCAAERWIGEAGLQEMVDAGYFDEDLAYVDQPQSALSAEMRAAALSAVTACVDSVPTP